MVVIPVMVAVIPAVVVSIIAVVIPVMVSVIPTIMVPIVSAMVSVAGARGAILIVAMRVAGTRALRAGLVGARIVGGTILAPGVNGSWTLATR